MASSSSSKDKRNFQCITEASLEIIKLPLKAILRSQIKPEDLFLKIKSILLLSGRNKLHPDQLNLCYFPPPLLPDYSNFDVTLLYTLIRNLCPGLEPTRGWGKEPGPNDTKTGDDIERLRLFRNKFYAHLNSATIPDEAFEDLWRTLEAVLSRLKSHPGCSVDYEQELIEIKRSKFKNDIWEHYRNLCKLYQEIEKEANERAEPTICIKGEEQVICGDTAEFKAEVKQAESFSFSIKWQRRRGRFVEIIDTTLEKYRGSTNTKLVIPSACKEDAWEYQASLSDENNHMFLSNAINLHVLGEIPFLNDLIVTVEDEKIIIHYSVGVPENSPHIQNIAWSKNGHPMYIESVKFIGGSARDSCLIINSPSEADKGKYSCTVTNAVGSETKHIVLDVPCIEISTKSPVHFASDTTLTSSVSSMPPPKKAVWQKSKNGNDFSELVVTKSKYFGSNVSPECPRLVIPKTTFDDRLYYRLQISNKLGVNVSNIVYLKVTGSLPNITVGHETDINNRSIKLRGVVFLSDDSPDIKNIFWFKNGEKLDIQGSGGRLSGVTIDDPSLTITNVSQEDAGKYQLTAINAIGQNNSVVISIDVPYLCIRSEKEFTGGIECMCFTVEITSNPGPCHAQWNIKSKGEETFTPLDVNAEKYQGSTNSLPHPKLVIKEKDQLKKNIYQIEVTNFVGSAVEEISGKESTEGGKESDSRVLSSDKELGRDRGKNILQREAAAKKMLTAEEEKIMDEAKYITLSRPSTAHLFSKGAQNQKEVLPSIVRAEVSKSVGLIHIDGNAMGTGFRVGEKYILTCEHVIKNAKVTDQIICISRVSIEFGRISNTPNRDYSRIFGIISIAYVDKEHDFVVLELRAHDSGVPFPPALTCFGQVCWSDVHLVGHPNCTQMMEDSVIPFWLPEHNDIVMPYIDKLSSWSKIFFPGDIDHYKELRCLIPRKIIFHTTFNHGSSGSPGVMISEDKPCVVLMVRGGVPGCVYENTYPDLTPFVLDNQKVEYGYAMEDIYKKMMNSSLEKYRNLASEIFKTWKC